MSDLSARRLDLHQFDSEIASFDGVVQEMTVAFAAARWPSVRLEGWVYEHGSTPVAAVLVMVQRLFLGASQLAVVKWGPILAQENSPDREEIGKFIIQHLKDEYADRRRMMLTVMPRADRPPLSNISDCLTEAGFDTGSQFLFPDRYLVNLRLTDQEQRHSFSQKWRYHLSKSEKNDLEFIVADRDELPVFDGLYRAMSDRKRFPDYSTYDTLQCLFDSDVAALHPKVFLVKQDSKPVAGAVIFTAGKTAVYLFGATNEEALDLRAGYFMHARIISWLRDNTHADWYDLGGTDGFHGLHQFKKGMVGRAGLIAPVPPIRSFAIHRRAKLVGQFAYAAKELVHSSRRFLDRLNPHSAKPDQGQRP